ncbi:MAG TPA: outer membrane protein transport protein [Gemmatimonadales bacterium]|nr:outer membrane protein transport protein [Gemmatimonadales bacterium]
MVGLPALGAAQGFGIYELNTCMMGRAGVGVAQPCPDGSAIFFNPAGLASLKGTHISVGGTLIRPMGGFTDDLFGQKTDMASQTFVVPNVYVTHNFGNGLAAGIGLYVPYGLGTEWPTTFPGRFSGYKTRLNTLYIQPTLAYQVADRLQLGIGIAYIHSSVELNQRLDLSAQALPATGGILPPGTLFSAIGIPAYTDFADSKLTGSGNGVAVHIGAILKITDRLSLGGRFMTRKTVTINGDVAFSQVNTGLVFAPGTTPLNPTTPLPIDLVLAPEFAPGAPLSNGTATTQLTLPDQWTLGLTYQLNPKWMVSGDFQQVVWGWFNALNVTFANPATPPLARYEGFRDTYGYRFGTEYQYSPKYTFRAGYLYHTSAAPDITVTPLLPEGSRNEFTLGIGATLTPQWHADLGYQYVRQNDRRGRTIDPATGTIATTGVNTGLYQFSAHLVALGLALTF